MLWVGFIRQGKMQEETIMNVADGAGSEEEKKAKSKSLRNRNESHGLVNY